MGSTDKYPSGLNNWLPEDRPQRQDFVDDNELLDGFMESHGTRHGKEGEDPVAPGDIGAAEESHPHDAGDISSGRLGVDRLPTSGTASRVLAVAGANTNPQYIQLGRNSAYFTDDALNFEGGGTNAKTAADGRKNLGALGLTQIWSGNFGNKGAANITVASLANYGQITFYVNGQYHIVFKSAHMYIGAIIQAATGNTSIRAMQIDLTGNTLSVVYSYLITITASGLTRAENTTAAWITSIQGVK